MRSPEPKVNKCRYCQSLPHIDHQPRSTMIYCVCESPPCYVMKPTLEEAIQMWNTIYGVTEHDYNQKPL
jgi:hypothetical protein